jgi:DNA-binding NarL/FixJ family response regulator
LRKISAADRRTHPTVYRATRTNSEIAEELHVGVRTIERHVANIYAKIGSRGRANATAYALTRVLV